jgi:crotonobetainyl-CoA:carnitine CoA-transferase CaiB-like acyl-CoA transferase
LRRAAPQPGQDSRSALAEWGLPSQEIEALEAAKAAAQT